MRLVSWPMAGLHLLLGNSGIKCGEWTVGPADPSIDRSIDRSFVRLYRWQDRSSSVLCPCSHLSLSYSQVCTRSSIGIHLKCGNDVLPAAKIIIHHQNECMRRRSLCLCSFDFHVVCI